MSWFIPIYVDKNGLDVFGHREQVFVCYTFCAFEGVELFDGGFFLADMVVYRDWEEGDLFFPLEEGLDLVQVDLRADWTIGYFLRGCR